ncbi:hypothetical protein [Actinomyces sp. ZJ308]|uniref:hypothetical protein n=1 Tax=Actinomyces sp. ZJ308 TaxID=2708342 RepID=UPI00141DB539|nr:hypothetical protein [Actinomyces sp. ZJ308]
MPPTPNDNTADVTSDDTAASTADSPEPSSQHDVALENRRQRHRRIIAALRSLRFGCLLALIAATILYFTCRSGITKVAGSLLSLSWKGMALTVFLWACGVVLWPEPRHDRPDSRSRLLAAIRSSLMLLPAALVLVSAGYTTTSVIRLWRTVFSTYTVNLGEALAYSAGIATFGLLLSTDVLLRAARATFEPYARQSLYGSDPISSRLLDLRDELRTQPWRSTARARGPRALLALVPVMALVASFTVPYIGHPSASRRPVIAQTTGPSVNADQLPEYPSGFTSQAMWTKNLPPEQNVTAGAAGPVILTQDGAIGLNPRDGATLWSYQRKGSTLWSYQHEGSAAGGVIHSPDGRYMAMRFTEPDVYASLTDTDGRLETSMPAFATVVLDTITGATIFDWRGDSPLQLTDSAVLYGTTAYSLTDRSKMWDLRELTINGASGSNAAQAGYSGTAGHSTFILTLPSEKRDVLAPQNDPTTTHGLPTLTPWSSSTASSSATNPGPVVIDGWVVVDKPGGKQVKPSWLKEKRRDTEVQAVNLDGLAGIPGADTRAYELGMTSEVNETASRQSGTLVTFPPLPAEEPPNSSPSPLPLWESSGTVGSVFNPRTLTVTTAAQTPGLAAASVGVTQVTSGETIEGRLTVKPGDGSPGASIPLAPGTTFSPPGDRLYNPQLKDLALADGKHDDNLVTAVATPGATIIMLQTGTRFSGTSRIYAVGGEAR